MIAETWRYCPLSDSTNQYLLDRIGELRSGRRCLCNIAEYQQAGRGRRGRKWFHRFGANLYLFNVLASGAGLRRQTGGLVIGIVMAVLREFGRR